MKIGHEIQGHTSFSRITIKKWLYASGTLTRLKRTDLPAQVETGLRLSDEPHINTECHDCPNKHEAHAFDIPAQYKALKSFGIASCYAELKQHSASDLIVNLE